MSDNTHRILDFARQSVGGENAEKISSLQTPAVAEILGGKLAQAMAAAEPETVIVWDQVESAVLAHVVARELEADLVYAFSVEGSLGLSGALRSGSRAIVVSYDWTELHGLDALVRFAQSQGAVVTGIGSIVPAPAPEARLGIETHTLTGGDLETPETPKENYVIDNG